MVTLRVNGLRFEAVGPPDQGLRLLPNVQVDDKPQGAGQIFALDILTTISIGGIVVPHRWEDQPQTGEDLGNWGSRELKLFVPLSRETIGRIESTRQHNVQVHTSPVLRYFGQQGPPKSAYPSGQTQLLIPQNEWLSALDRMGYRSGWILEVERPQVEGWDLVVAFLEKAAERIASRDPEGSIAQCRAAWNTLDPLLDAKWPDVGVEVDRGSKSEEGYPMKSERAKSLRAAIRSWSNTGAHPESYAASMDDAFLAYRLTASLISYLSRMSTRADSHRPP